MMELPLTTKSGWEKERNTVRRVSIPGVQSVGRSSGSLSRRRARTMGGARGDCESVDECWQGKISRVYEILGGGREVRVGLLTMVVATSGLFERKGDGRKFVGNFLGRNRGSVDLKEFRRVVTAVGKKVWQGMKEDVEDGEVVERVCTTLIAAKLAMGKSWNVGVFLMAIDSVEMKMAIEPLRNKLMVLFENLADKSGDVDRGDNKSEKVKTVEYQYVRVFMEEMRMAPVSEVKNSKFEKDLVACLAHHSNTSTIEKGSAFIKALSKRRLCFDEFLWCVSFYAFDAYGDRQNCLGKPRVLSTAVSTIVNNISEGFFRVVTSPQKNRTAVEDDIFRDSFGSLDWNPASPIMNKDEVEREPTSGEGRIKGVPESGSIITPEGSSTTPQRHIDFGLKVVEESMESDSVYVNGDNSRVHHPSKYFDDEYEFQFVDDVQSDEYNSANDGGNSSFCEEPAGYAGAKNEVDAATMCAFDDAREKYDMVANDVQHIITDFSLVGDDLVDAVDRLKNACEDIESMKQRMEQEMMVLKGEKRTGLLERGYRIVSGLSTIIVVIMVIGFIMDCFDPSWSNQFSYAAI